MGAKQLEEDYQDLVIKELSEYRALKVRMKNKQEQAASGITNLFPTLLQCEQKDILKLTQVQRALDEALDPIERAIIEKKYLACGEEKDIEIYLALGIKKGRYYKKKKSAIYHLAKALGIK